MICAENDWLETAPEQHWSQSAACVASVPKTTPYAAGWRLLTCHTAYDYDFAVALWFPTEQQEVAYAYNACVSGSVSQGGSMAAGRFPLVVISSGYAGTMFDQCYLAEALARQGYCVAAVSHKRFDYGEQLGSVRAWYRAKEIQAAIDRLTQDNRISAHLQANDQVHLIGFAQGGYSAALVAGAMPDFKRERSFRPFLKPVDELDFTQVHDGRIGSLSLLAPALSGAVDKASLKQLTMPTLLMTAECDEVLGRTTERYRDNLPNLRKVVQLRQAGHYVFNAAVSPIMQKLAPATCWDPHVPRQFCHPVIVAEIGRFLRQGMLSTAV